MLESIYIGLTGLSTFSKGLTNISNNVSNLNTPGFKRSQLMFEDLLYKRDSSGRDTPEDGVTAQGNGVTSGKSTVVYEQGELRSTANDQDAGIDGNGFFVFRKDGEIYYSRGGQFELNADGVLVSRLNQAHVAALDAGGRLTDINTKHNLTNPAQATTSISLTGNLNQSDLAASPYTLSTINVVAADGSSHVLSAIFKNEGSTATPVERRWTITIQEGITVVAQGSVNFRGDGSLQTGSENFSFSYTPSGGQAQNIKLVFGEAGILSHGLTNYSGVQTAPTVESSDGRAYGTLTKITFDTDGYVVASYSNGQTEKIYRLALAWFDFLGGLSQDGGNFYVNDTTDKPIYGTAGDGLFGRIKGGYIEASNVDLTQQFSELIVTQRGYQASSQVVTAANEMIQQALDIKGRK